MNGLNNLSCFVKQIATLLGAKVDSVKRKPTPYAIMEVAIMEVVGKKSYFVTLESGSFKLVNESSNIKELNEVRNWIEANK